MKPKKPFLEGFEADVFISYSRRDDTPVMDDELGWVSQLHKELVDHLPEYLGDDAWVWRDQEDIRNNEDFEQKIFRQLGRTGAFLAVLSESFLKRNWCIRELQGFIEQTENNLGIYVDSSKKRIFKVEKMPVHRDLLPEALQRTDSYKFYDESGRILRPTINERHRQKFWETVEDLLKDLSAVLRALARQTQGSATEAAPPMAVYVAETTSDLEAEAAEVRRDLKERGYRVLPAGDLPRRLGPFCEDVRKGLAEAVLSVHLVGGEYGFVPEGETSKSNVRLQHDLALERGRDPDFVRVLWISGARDPADERQARFIAYLDEDAEAQEGAELLKGCGLEDLKTELHDKLERIAEAREKRRQAEAAPAGPEGASLSSAGTSDEPPLIYVMCDGNDRQSAALAALRKYLLAEGYEPVLLDEGEGGSSLDEHKWYLNSCDACLIYFGEAPQRWFEQKLSDLRKYLRGRAKPVLAKAVYHVPPQAGRERDVATNEAMVLRGSDLFAPEQLQPFMDRLRGGPGARAS